MSHKPRSAERPVKAETIDRMHKKAHDALNQAVSRPRPMNPAQMTRIDKLGIKKG